MENTAPEKKKIIFSAIQPTGVFTLGNYLGAIKNWKNLQDDYNCLFSVADLHAITVRQESAALRKQSLDSAALLLACGIDPEKSILFLQSHNPRHAELAWVLNCYTSFGELSRMTQFKDKSAKNEHNINAGLFTYPALMAADILLYGTDLVPVGLDQKQHVELARDIAERFNQLYGDTFTVPEPYILQTGKKIYSLAEPTKKMSKSDENLNSFIGILDTRDVIIKKFKRAVTDSDTCVRYAEGKDGINNLMTIYSCFTGKTMEEIEREFDGKGYGDFKTAVGQVCCDKLIPVQQEYQRILADKAYLEEVMKKGADEASYYARKTLSKVRRKLGFVNL